MMKKLLVILFLFLNFDTQALSKELSCKNNPKCKNFPKVTKIQGIKYPLTMVQKQRGEKPTGDLERDLKLWVRKQIGPIATPDVIQFAPGLPKTRSGKIMRRILRKIAANEPDNLGDTTTLADPSVVTSLVENRQNKG